MRDKRGKIKDLFVTKDRSVTYITFKPGAVRGNHYHKETTQIDILLKGELICAYKGKKEDKETFVLKEGGVMVHQPSVSHAYEAVEDSEMISICFGKRVGKNYEKDTFRLTEPLL